MNNYRVKIMVIDDDIDIIDSIKAFISKKYYFEGYTKSKTGIKRLKESKFDILILDYFIDELNGKNVIDEIRRFDKDIYILLLTGHKNKVPGLKSLECLEIQNYCEKTADFENVIICIESAVKSIEFFKSRQHLIGERIKKLRKFYNLSQVAVAKALEIHRTAISSYESGDVIPPTLSIIKLAKLFNVTTDYILCYELKVEKNSTFF